MKFDIWVLVKPQKFNYIACVTFFLDLTPFYNITEWDEIYGLQIMVDIGLSNRNWVRSLKFSFDAS